MRAVGGAAVANPQHPRRAGWPGSGAEPWRRSGRCAAGPATAVSLPPTRLNIRAAPCRPAKPPKRPAGPAGHAGPAPGFAWMPRLLDHGGCRPLVRTAAANPRTYDCFAAQHVSLKASCVRSCFNRTNQAWATASPKQRKALPNSPAIAPISCRAAPFPAAAIILVAASRRRYVWPKYDGHTPQGRGARNGAGGTAAEQARQAGQPAG